MAFDLHFSAGRDLIKSRPRKGERPRDLSGYTSTLSSYRKLFVSDSHVCVASKAITSHQSKQSSQCETRRLGDLLRQSCDHFGNWCTWRFITSRDTYIHTHTPHQGRWRAQYEAEAPASLEILLRIASLLLSTCAAFPANYPK